MESAVPKKARSWRLSFRVTVITIFLFLTMTMALIGIALQYYFSTRLATDSTLTLYQQAAEQTRAYLTSIDQSTSQILKLAAPRLGPADDLDHPQAMRALMTTILQENPLYYASYVGFPNGDYYELINLDSGVGVRQQLMALPQDRWVVLTVRRVDGERRRTMAYYDQDFTLRTRRDAPTNYDPTSRPWYQHAKDGVVFKTPPYLFQHLQLPGQTYAMRISGTQAVMAIDITLASLSDHLRARAPDPESRIFLYQKNGQLIAGSNHPTTSVLPPVVRKLDLTASEKNTVAKAPVLTVSSLMDWPPFDFSIAGNPQGYTVDMLSLIGQMTGLRFDYVNGPSWPQFVDMFRQGRVDMLGSVMCDGNNAMQGIQTAPYVHAPIGVLTRTGAPRVDRIEQLYGKRVAIPAGWSIIGFLQRHFPKIQVVTVDGVSGMFAAVRAGQVFAGIDNAAELRYTKREFFYDDVTVTAPLSFGAITAPTGLCFVAQKKHKAAVSLINQALNQLTPAQKTQLKNRWLLTDEARKQPSATVPFAALVDMAADPGQQNRLIPLMLGGQKQFVYVTALGKAGVSDAYFGVLTPVSRVLAPAYQEVRQVMWLTLIIWVLVLPLAYWLATLIVTPVKLLAIEEEKIRDKKYAELKPVSSHIGEIDDLAVSQREMAQAIQRHAEEQEALIDAFILLIAQAIDEKSPYTGGHCARVPVIAMMLAERAHESEQPPFDAFHFKNDSEWREFRISAWLHDCGKITTPEFVVDKGRKLETIYNRIHEIRTRFEVLWRDAQITYLENCLRDPQAEPAHKDAWVQQQAQLQTQFAFIAGCNQGGEAMSEAQTQTLEALAQITWIRHFDDRLGLSPAEQRHLQTCDHDASLPQTEYLLQDKPWHRIPRTATLPCPERFGIHMAKPELLYNRGELYNLKILRGTLTTEDRYKINEHVISTIRMLDRLPLPENLKRVPRYASTHHETLDGRGYPRQLTAKDLSMPERIMVLADIFEALTASDRPYKNAKTLSEALDLIHKMVQEQHIDRDVFNLFLISGTYREYAQQYLKPEQIDTVDLSRYLSADTRDS